MLRRFMPIVGLLFAGIIHSLLWVIGLNYINVSLADMDSNVLSATLSGAHALLGSWIIFLIAKRRNRS